MQSFKLKAGIAIALAMAAMPAAAFAYSEDFNSPGFIGSPILVNDNSDRFGPTNYYTINNFDGFAFSGGAYLAQSLTGDGALLINEPDGAAATTLSGLTAGQVYALTFLLSGDNIPGGSYVLHVALGGNTTDFAGVDLPSGTNPGTLETVTFTPTGTTESLLFTQSTPGQASPIIDNLSVSAAPEPATWALMFGGVAMIGAALRFRRRDVRAAATA